MYVTISKRFKTVDKQEKSNSSVQLFLEVYYHQRFIITRNIIYENKIITFLKLNEFDQFYKKKLVAYFSKIFEPQSVELEKLSGAEESKKPTHTNIHANVMIFSKNICHFADAILIFGKSIFKFGISDRSNFRGSTTLR